MGERILIVDDEGPLSLLLERAFRDEGYLTARAADGMECLNKLLTVRPDVIIMDIMMPRLDGVETTRLIRRNRTYADTIVIALSARTDEETRQAMSAAGANLYMRKPFTIARLLERVRELLAERAA
jgi:DNA-binding response OmpR family regulator